MESVIMLKNQTILSPYDSSDYNQTYVDYYTKSTENINHYLSLRGTSRILIDWLSFTIPSSVGNHLLAYKILGIPEDSFVEQRTSFYGYQVHLKYQDISILYNDKPRLDDDGNTLTDQGTHIQMSGQGCRIFEAYHQLQKCNEYFDSSDFESWTNLFANMKSYNAKVSRLDVAVDLFNDSLSLSTMDEYLHNGHYTSRLNEVTFIESKSIFNTYGQSIYVGKGKYDISFRFYDKKIQFFDKPFRKYVTLGKQRETRNLPLEQELFYQSCKELVDTFSWVRAESQFRHAKDNEVYELLSSGLPIGTVVNSIFLNYLVFREPTISRKTKELVTKKCRWKMCDWWSDFVGDVEPMSLSTSRPASILSSKMDYLMRNSKLIATVHHYLFAVERLENPAKYNGTESFFNTDIYTKRFDFDFFTRMLDKGKESMKDSDLQLVADEIQLYISQNQMSPLSYRSKIDDIDSLIHDTIETIANEKDMDWESTSDDMPF